MVIKCVTFRGFGPSQQLTITFNIPGYGEHLPNRGINTNGYPNYTKQHTQRFSTCGEHLLSCGINTDVYLYNTQYKCSDRTMLSICFGYCDWGLGISCVMGHSRWFEVA